LIKLYPPEGTGTGSAYVLAASTTCDWSLTARWRWSCRAFWPGATLASTPAPSPTRWARFRPAPASPSNRSGRQHLRRPTGPASPPITTPSLSGKLYNLHIQQPLQTAIYQRSDGTARRGNLKIFEFFDGELFIFSKNGAGSRLAGHSRPTQMPPGLPA
jgi:hypothetical protein